MGTSPLEFSPYSTYEQGVRVAVGDVTGDGRAEIVLGGRAAGDGYRQGRPADLQRTGARDSRPLPRRRGRRAAARRSAWINWVDGTGGRGIAVPRDDGVYTVRALKRYRRPGCYAATSAARVTVGRVSVARSKAIVRRH